MPSPATDLIFTTERLNVRRWRDSDFASILAVYGDEDAMRWVGDGEPLSAADATRWLEVTRNNYTKRGYGMFAIESTPTGEVIGFIGIVHPDDQLEAEVKYALARQHWGMGLATEALRGVVEYGAEAHELTALIATTAPANKASHRVLEKCGFVRGELRTNEDGSRTQVFEWRGSATVSERLPERLRADIEALTSYPDRRVGSPGHAAALKWTLQKMSALGLLPFAGSSHALPYTTGGQEFTNVVGITPSASGDSTVTPVVFGAHYDTVPGTPGADDNAASVAVVLEVAARLLESPAERPVVIAIFDAEEPPYFQAPAMGSIRLVEDHIRDHAHAAIILDLIAHDVPLERLERLVALMGAESHPAWAAIVRAVAEGPLPILSLPNEIMPDMSDHRAFRLAQHPFLFVTCGQGPNYHHHSDTLENVALNKVALVTDLVENLVRWAAVADFNGASPHDSSDLDFELLQRAISDEALAYFGIRSPRDSKHGLMQLVMLMQENRSR